MPRQPDILAEVTFCVNERTFHSGYIPITKFEGSELSTSGKLLFIDNKSINAGHNLTVYITILWLDAFNGFLFPEQKIEFFEGSHLVGSGKILQVLNSYLEKTY